MLRSFLDKDILAAKSAKCRLGLYNNGIAAEAVTSTEIEKFNPSVKFYLGIFKNTADEKPNFFVFLKIVEL